MPEPLRLRVCVIALVTAVGCGSPDSGRDTVVRDSLGVRIVETTSLTRYAAPIQVHTAASFKVGVVEGELPYVLSRVAGAMQLPNEEIIVADGGTNELRFFSSSGEFLGAEGREGEGPGEFEYLRGLGRCREGGFIAFDLSWQMNAYNAEGRFLERSVLRAPSGITPYNLACDSDGHFLIIGWGRQALEGPQVGFYQARDRLLLVSADGEIVTDFGEHLVSERIGLRTGSRPHPAGRATVFALHDQRVYVGSGERFEVELRDLDGNLKSLLRGPLIPLQVTDSIKAAYLDMQLSSASQERRAAVRQDLEGWEWPPSIPAYTRLFVDPKGVAWVRAFTISTSEPESWSLLDPGRGYIGDVTLGKGQQLLEVGADYLLVVQRDALEVESVAKFGLDRGNDS